MAGGVQAAKLGGSSSGAKERPNIHVHLQPALVAEHRPGRRGRMWLGLPKPPASALIAGQPCFATEIKRKSDRQESGAITGTRKKHSWDTTMNEIPKTWPTAEEAATGRKS